MNAPFKLDLDVHIGASTRAFLAREHRLLIGGNWVAAADGATAPVIDPATGHRISTMAVGGPADIDLAVRAARDAFEDGPWRTTTTGDRAKMMWRLAELIDQHGDELAELDVLDEGSPYDVVRNFYIKPATEHLRYYAGWATKITGQSIPINSAANWHAHTIRQAVGVVGAIIPWNVPLLMAIWKMSPALAAGCTIVLKPAEDTPLTAIRLGELVLEAGFPPGVLNVVTGDGRAGAALAAHWDVDKVAFTGSTATGKKIVESAIGNLKKVSLELGGKSPVFVFDDADIDAAIPAVADAVYLNSGQACTAGSRLYIHEKVYDRVIEGVARYSQGLKLGHGLDRSVQLGPLVSQKQFSRVTDMLNEGIRSGARVASGGARHGSEGFFVQPTLLTDVTDGMTIAREEIFGPIISAMRFSDEGVDSLVRRANASEYGLSASVWTNNVKTAHNMARGIKAGVVWVNAHNLFDAGLPFGGFKQSGWGREMGFNGIELYTEVKSVVVAL